MKLLAAITVTAALALVPADGAQAQDYIACVDEDRTPQPRQHPRRCETFRNNVHSLFDLANLSRLRWRSWGGITAYARGCDFGYPASYCAHVRLKFYRRVWVESGAYFYTRMRMRDARSTHVLRLDVLTMDAQ